MMTRSADATADVILSIRLDGDSVEVLLPQLFERLDEPGCKIRPASATRFGTRQALTPMELVATLGSAGAFTALVQILNKFLKKGEGNEVTIQRGSTKVTVKGHSLLEERALLDQFAPELKGAKKR